MKPFLCAPFISLIICVALVQQVRTVDLSHLLEHSAPPRKLPDGCKELKGGVIADELKEADDHRPFEITVKVLSVKDPKAILGSDLEAKVQLQNLDVRPLAIPWSEDPDVIRKGQDPNSFTFDVGTFDFSLKDKAGHQVPLTGLSASAFGSKYSPGSEITLTPGESVEAIVKLRLESLYPMPIFQLREGEEQLLATWRQEERTRSVKDCAVNNLFSHYDNYYHQRTLGLTVQFSTERPTPDK